MVQTTAWYPEIEKNVDGAFTSAAAGAGMVLRNHMGHMIVAACWSLPHCIDALESELAAMELGLEQAILYSQCPIVLESDCADALSLISDPAPDLSQYATRVQTIKEIIREKEIRCAKVDREANVVSHSLAALGRVQGRSQLWLVDPPEAIRLALLRDSTPTSS